MMPEAVGQIRASLVEGHDALDRLTAAMARAFTKRLKPADRRKLCAARDHVARLLALWREGLSDEPELLARVESLGEQIRQMPTRRGRGTQSSSRGATKQDC